MFDQIDTVILAAGKGTRLALSVPKPLAPLGKKTLIDYVMKAVEGSDSNTFIVGHQASMVEEYIVEAGYRSAFVLQKEQKGTGHAVQTYFENTSEHRELTLVLCADTPLLQKQDLERLINSIDAHTQAVAATFETSQPYGYGRIVRGGSGFKIVEQKDANDDEKRIKEVNSGVYLFKTQYLKKHIQSLNSSNAANEFYLTDIFSQESEVRAIKFDSATPFFGVNDLIQLSVAEKEVRRRLSCELMKKGVRFEDPDNSYVLTLNIGEGSFIHAGVHIDENSHVGENCIIESNVRLSGTIIGDNCHIKDHSVLDSSCVGDSCKVGPMAHLRPGSKLSSKVKIGNFVELKKSHIGSNTNISHLSYLGDADIGNNVNIGCGFITCNYDGAKKHITKVGDGSFIGSDCQVIAPISIGKNTYVGSGSTINQNIPDEAFAIARTRQVTKEGLAKRFMRKK